MLNPDFRDMLSALCDENVEFLVAVLGRRHLLQNKKAAGRPQDLADVARLERRPGE